VQSEFRVKPERTEHRDLSGDHDIAKEVDLTGRQQAEQHHGAGPPEQTHASVEPDASIATSTVSGQAGSSGRSARTVVVAPTSRASASGSSSRSLTMISAAPAARSAMTTSNPIGPAPVTNARFPATSPARWTACRATDKGSASTARSMSRQLLLAIEHAGSLQRESAD
jgi:hypothetical protein